MIRSFMIAAAFSASVFAISAAKADDALKMGPWNAGAEAVAEKSPLVQSAMALLKASAEKIQNETIRKATLDAVFNKDTCILHRANLDDAKKKAIMEKLAAEGLLDETEDKRIPGGQINGVFPPVRDDGTACPKLPLAYYGTPGSVFGGHHSQPGGLPTHVAVNMTSSINLADTYRKVYGTVDAKGEPVVRQGAAGEKADDTFVVSEDIAIGAPIWHDWAKTIVFQWNADGSEFAELNFGGNNKTDAWGAPGKSATGGHHILGIAEDIARGLPADFMIAHASAHQAPNAGNEFNVVNWIRAASIIVGVDPVAKGYLQKDALGRLRLAAVRKTGSIDIQASLPNQPNMLYEYVMHNLSDADYTYTGTAAVQADLLLKILGKKFGYDSADATKFNTQFRNIVLSHLGAERILTVYANGGVEAVEAMIAKLKTDKFVD